MLDFCASYLARKLITTENSLNCASTPREEANNQKNDARVSVGVSVYGKPETERAFFRLSVSSIV
jgi:hypothetical protein